MIELLTASQTLPFGASLGVMLAIALLEGVATVMGMGVSGFLDSLLPDLEVDLDVPDVEAPSALSRLLGWLRIGQVPVLMLLVVFLTAFGLIGLGLQSASRSLVGFFMPAPIAVIPTFLLALPCVRLFGGLLSRFMPQDETDAVAESSFIGRVAVITLGTAKAASPAQAKLRDARGTTHYVMIEPDVEGEEFGTGSSVLIVRQKGAVFTAIRADNDALTD